MPLPGCMWVPIFVLTNRQLYPSPQFVHIPVESIKNIAHPEESIVVFGAILNSPKMDSLSNWIKTIICNYSTKKGGVPGKKISFIENK